MYIYVCVCVCVCIYIYIYNKTSIKQNIIRGADKSLARPGRKQTTLTEDF